MKRITLLLLSVYMFLLTSCSSAGIFEHYKDYPLISVTFDENELDISSVYPEGSYIRISDSGKGVINLGEGDCRFEFTDENGKFSAKINNIPVYGAANDDTVVLNISDTGLKYTFSKTEKAEKIISEAEKENKLQKRWNGNWKGRLFFDNPTGIWSEYLYRSMELHGTIRLDSDGNGVTALISPAYSEYEPALILSFTADNKKAECVGGYLFSYKIEKGGSLVSIDNVFKTDVRSTEFIDPKDYPWYMDDQSLSDKEQVAEKTDLIKITGKCINNEDSFDYEIVITKE